MEKESESRWKEPWLKIWKDYKNSNSDSKEAGVSQSYVANHIGISTQSVSNWECDNTMPDISQIVPLAALLSVSTDYLLGVGTNERADKEELEEKVKPAKKSQ